jgi:hypothetical protein
LVSKELIGTIVAASAPEVEDGMSTGMSTRGTKRQRCIKQEEDNQTNVTFKGIDVIDDFGPIIPSPSGDVDPVEVDLHSRGSISAVPELELAAYSNHGIPPPVAEPLPPPPLPPLPLPLLPSSSPASNKTVPPRTAISLPVDDVLARM